MKTLAIVGAGPALGMSLARRFGGEGFQVGLVARRHEQLDAFVKELNADGIRAAAFPADVTKRTELKTRSFESGTNSARSTFLRTAPLPPLTPSQTRRR